VRERKKKIQGTKINHKGIKYDEKNGIAKLND